MRKYEKIDTIFARDINGTKKLMPNVFRDETVAFLANIPWQWTEKVDGTNVRIIWDGHSVSFAGRTDNSVLPEALNFRLWSLFGGSTNEEMFEQLFGDKEVILFGEGYGHKIQKCGSQYSNDVKFILFDVLIGDNYQSRSFVETIARSLNIDVVPILGTGTLDQAIEFVKSKPDSIVAQNPLTIEGVVCRPVVELRDRCGNRIIVKIKVCDFE